MTESVYQNAKRQRGAILPTPDNDTWESSAGTWTLVATPSEPSARHTHDMVYDASRNEVFMFGGDLNPLAGAFVGDTWTFGNSVAVPTVSEWGLIVMTVVGLAIGAFLFARPQRTRSAV